MANDVLSPAENRGIAELTGFTIRDVITADELRSMPLGLRIEFVQELREQFEGMAHAMAKNELTRPHLKDKPDACFSIIKNALNWRMDPHQVAAKTYSPAAGQIGIEGVLASAIMLNSGRVRLLTYEYSEGWERIQGKFKRVPATWPDGNPKKKKNPTTGKYDGDPVFTIEPDWKIEDEAGLWVVAIAEMMDGRKVRTPEIYLSECHPRNALTWNTSPKRQIIHVAERLICNMTCGDILMGVHLDVGLTRHFDEQAEEQDEPRDITPPKAAAPASMDGIKGAGASEPMTESSYKTVAEEFDTETGEIIEQAEDEAKTKRKRVSLTWQGKPVYKTKFVRDIKFKVAEIDDYDELVSLKSAVADAVKESSDPDAFEELEVMFKEELAEYEFEDPTQSSRSSLNLTEDD